MRLDGSSYTSSDQLPVSCHHLTCSQPHSDPPRRRCRDAAVRCTRQAINSKSASASDDTGGKRRVEKKRQLVLLSCSHLFHASCLQAMEEFVVERTQHVCPVCRSNYHTKHVNTWLTPLYSSRQRLYFSGIWPLVVHEMADPFTKSVGGRLHLMDSYSYSYPIFQTVTAYFSAQEVAILSPCL